MDDDISNPGEFALEGALPQDNSPTVDQPENLATDFSPSLDNLLPTSTPIMDDDLATEFSDWLPTGDPSTGVSGGLLTSTEASGLLGLLQGTGTSLLNAFVTNPQNATTAEQQQLASAEISSSLASQIFGYALIGLVAYFLITAFEKK